MLQAVRSLLANYGVRVTGVRPPDTEDYTMVVYGGTEAEFGALGSAPSGDCDNAFPNDIAFAHVDGPLSDWVTGGATTAAHEAAHTWGLDHVDRSRELMFPTAGARAAYVGDTCLQVVKNVQLDPGGASCPERNIDVCDDAQLQHNDHALTRLFGPGYRDQTAPTVTVVYPQDGQYFQAPATFTVELVIADDLHPQQYRQWVHFADESRPKGASRLLEPSFSVKGLDAPGMYNVVIVIADEAGNETEVDFSFEVGDGPAPAANGSGNDHGCTLGTKTPLHAAWWALCVPAFLPRKRLRPAPESS